MELCVIGLNHRTAPVQLREQFSVAPDRLQQVLAGLKSQVGLAEVLVLSTCNRLEVYAVSEGEICPERALSVLASSKANSPRAVTLAQLDSSVYVHRNQACIQHLFRVASSLDSLVVGETEIVGQVKTAYKFAQEAKATGKTLNRLFQKALSISKDVRTRSGIGRCSTSVGSVALDLAMKIFGEDLTDRTFLIVGAGKMGETTLKHLTKHGAKSVLVTNRSFDRALELVSQFQGEAVPFENLDAALARADIVVSSTSAPHYVLQKPAVAAAMAQRPDRPLLLVDLAVPRDIDPSALDVASVFLYNIDQLSELARLNMERRQTEAAACEDLVRASAREASAQVLGQNERPMRECPVVTPRLGAGRLALA